MAKPVTELDPPEDFEFNCMEIVRTCLRCGKWFGQKEVMGCGICKQCHEDKC